MKYKFLQLLKSVLKPTEFDPLALWLEDSDFFTAPASTKFHSSKEGGLLEHSLLVYELLEEKNRRYNIELTDKEVVVAGLLHDVCKINFYHKEKRWRKVDGKWEDYYPWVVGDKEPLGHGEKSVILLQKYLKLTEQEIYMIRWHMGPISSLTGSSGIPLAYYEAVKKYPAIVAMFTADYEAATFMEVQ